MDEQKVRDAVKVTNEIVNIHDAGGQRNWELVFNALTYETPSTPSSFQQTDIERFLSATGGPCQAITVKQTDPKFFAQLCKQFDVEFSG